MPEPFRLPADAANPLFVSNRSAPINGGAPMPDSTVAADIAMEESAFLGSTQFQRSLEVSPHNGVHVQVGGGMGAVNLAAPDPIFWAHHANIDRLWKRWLVQGGGRADPTADDAFMNTVFTFFDEDGDAVEMTGKEVLDTVNQLDYRYDDDCHRVPPPVKLLAAREAATPGGRGALDSRALRPRRSQRHIRGLYQPAERPEGSADPSGARTTQATSPSSGGWHRFSGGGRRRLPCATS